MVEHLEDGLGRAGGKPARAARERGQKRSVGHAVDVLGRVKDGRDDALVKLGRQRPEHEAAVHRGVGVDGGHAGEKLLLRAAGAKDAHVGVYTDLLAALEEAALIGEVVRALPHPNDGKSRCNAGGLEGIGAGGETLGERAGDGRALQQLCHQDSLLTLAVMAADSSRARGTHSARSVSHSRSSSAARTRSRMEAVLT